MGIHRAGVGLARVVIPPLRVLDVPHHHPVQRLPRRFRDHRIELDARHPAPERLLLLTLTAFAGAAALLIAFATRLSVRIRHLRDEAESAIDARGRLTRLASGSEASDEIGDLAPALVSGRRRGGEGGPEPSYCAS